MTLGYSPGPMGELPEDAGVPLIIVTAQEPSPFLDRSGRLLLRDYAPCQSLSARDEARHSAEFDLIFPCAFELPAPPEPLLASALMVAQ
jgi:hypothetical protein